MTKIVLVGSISVILVIFKMAPLTHKQQEGQSVGRPCCHHGNRQGWEKQSPACPRPLFTRLKHFRRSSRPSGVIVARQSARWVGARSLSKADPHKHWKSQEYVKKAAYQQHPAYCNDFKFSHTPSRMTVMAATLNLGIVQETGKRQENLQYYCC